MSAPSLLELAPAPVCCHDERWALIPSWPHEASTCGRVRSIDRLGDDGIWRLGALLPAQPDKRPGKGYLYYDLRDGTRRRRIPASVAVLEAHDRLRPGPGFEACHGNDIRTDNHWVNLCWDTKIANLAKMWEQRRQMALSSAETASALETPETCLQGRSPRVQQGVVPVSARVRRNASQGTGRPPSIPVSPSHSLPVQPSLRTLRTSFRSLRARLAA